jgi:hypothetical protein
MIFLQNRLQSRNLSTILMRTSGRPRHRREDNIKYSVWILEKLDLMTWLCLFRISRVGFCEHGNEPSRSNEVEHIGFSRRIILSSVTYPHQKLYQYSQNRHDKL